MPCSIKYFPENCRFYSQLCSFHSLKMKHHMESWNILKYSHLDRKPTVQSEDSEDPPSWDVSMTAEERFTRNIYIHSEKSTNNLNITLSEKKHHLNQNLHFLSFNFATPLKTNMTMEKEPFEDVSPIRNGDFPLTKRLKKGLGLDP